MGQPHLRWHHHESNEVQWNYFQLSNNGFHTSYQTLNIMVGMKDWKHIYKRFIIKHAFSKIYVLHNILSTVVKAVLLVFCLVETSYILTGHYWWWVAPTNIWMFYSEPVCLVKFKDWLDWWDVTWHCDQEQWEIAIKYSLERFISISHVIVSSIKFSIVNSLVIWIFCKPDSRQRGSLADSSFKIVQKWIHFKKV